jgi:hypothetical protein
MTHATILYFVIDAIWAVSQNDNEENTFLNGTIPSELGRLTSITLLDLGTIGGNCVCCCCTSTGGDCMTHVAVLYGQ